MTAWTPRHRDAASRRIERLTAGAAAVGVLAASALGYGLAQTATAEDGSNDAAGTPGTSSLTVDAASVTKRKKVKKHTAPRPSSGGGSVSSGGS